MSDVGAAAPAVVSCVLGGVRFAVELDALQQVLPRPLNLTTMPRRGGGLQGVFTHRGEVVPMVDLRTWLPWPGDDLAAPAQQQLLLRQDGRSLAVGIDRLDGLHRAGAGRVQRLHHGDDADELFHSVITLAGHADRGETESALGLLDVPSLMRLSRIWMQAQGGVEGAAEPSAGVDPDGQGPGPTSLRKCALLECDGERLALETLHLQTVIPMPALRPLWHGDPHLLGLARWRGRDVPVLQTLPTLGLGENRTGPAALLAIIEHDGLCMGLTVQAVREVQGLDLASAQPATALGMAPNRCLTGLLHGPDGRRILVVDAAALVEDNPLCTISADATRAVTGDRQAQAEAQVVVDAGSPWAIPISALLGITELPAGWAPKEAAAPWCHTWRGRTVPLWDLRALTGRGATATGAETRVLYLPSGSQVVGLVVESLRHLLPARTTELHTLRHPDGRHLRMVTHHDGRCDRSFEAFDLAAWLPAVPARQVADEAFS